MLYQMYYYFPVEGSWWLVVGAIYPLHWYWFSGWISQQKRLRKTRQEERQQTMQNIRQTLWQTDGLKCFDGVLREFHSRQQEGHPDLIAKAE
jgi:hypothetical protein